MAKRYLGVDYGTKRIGLAVADAGLTVARPLQIIDSNFDGLRRIIADESITDIVLGLPRSLEGTDTAQTNLVRAVAAKLESFGLRVILQDEAATSEQARSAGLHQKHYDDQAAAIILQDYLETL